MPLAPSVQERLADIVRAATRGHADYAFAELRDSAERHRAVAGSARADAVLIAALRAWAPDAAAATSASQSPTQTQASAGALARSLEDAARRGSARLFRQLDADWLARELDVGQQRLDLPDAHPPRSALVLPLALERGGTGVLALFSLEDDAYDGAGLEACGALARMAAGMLERDAFATAASLAERAREDFLSVVSHELRSPLTTIIGYADLLKTGQAGTLNEIQRERVDRIAGSAWELVRDLERIMELVRAGSPETEPRPDTIELATFTTSVARIVEPIANEKGLDFRIARPESRVEIVTDPDKLRRALLNLLHNAVRYTKAGWVALESSADAGGHVRFRVRDTGVGITPDMRARIFQPFGRGAGAPPGGLGVGLSLTRQLVRQLQGELRLDSEPGRGTIVTVELPRRLASARRETQELPLLASA